MKKILMIFPLIFLITACGYKNAEECIVKRDHFNVIFSAQKSSLQDLIVSERDDAVVHSNLMAPLQRSLDAIPTLSFLVGKTEHAPMNGPGEIFIGGEATRIAARAYAVAHHPPLHLQHRAPPAPLGRVATPGGTNMDENENY